MDGLVTRDIVNFYGEVVGSLSLPEETTEEEWELRLFHYVKSSTPKYLTVDEIVDARIGEATVYGRLLIREFAKRNVLAGLSLEQVSQIASNFKDLQLLLYSGTLTVALKQITEIQATPEVPQTIINEFANKLRVFLKIPIVRDPVEESTE